MSNLINVKGRVSPAFLFTFKIIFPRRNVKKGFAFQQNLFRDFKINPPVP